MRVRKPGVEGPQRRLDRESKEEADHLFQGLSSGGQIEFPISDSPWGSYFGMFRDKYGIEWMVSFENK